MIYHLITGDLAAAPLTDALNSDSGFSGEVVVMKDVLSVGPLKKEDGQSFSVLRSEFWQQVAPFEKSPIEVNDLDRLIETANQLAKNPADSIWIWIAPLPADLCMYFWCLKYLGKYCDRLYVVNIAGLPFLDENGKLFFPKSIAEILPTQIVKASKLARLINATELEMDQDEWERLMFENGGVRVLEGNKKIASKPESHYDQSLLAFCTHQFQKATRIIGQAIQKYGIPTGDYYLGWRLRQLYETGRLILQGDPNGKIKDYDVKIPGEDQQLELGL